MFKENYKKEAENIRLSDDKKAYLLYKLNRAEQDEGDKKLPRHPYAMRRALAAALCLALVVGCAFWVNKTPVTPQITQVQNAESYTQLYQLNKKLLSANKGHEYTLFNEVVDLFTGGSEKESITDDDAIDLNTTLTDAPTATGGSAKPNYSSTNTQHADVDEADIVKTDGRYIYALSQNHNRVTILQAAGADTQKCSVITVPQKVQVANGTQMTHIESMYVWGDHLVLIVTQTLENKGLYGALVYDISDRQAPKKQKTVLQSGAAESTRLVDGVLYIVSKYYVSQKPEQEEPSTYVPHTLEDNVLNLCPAENITVLPASKAAQYTVVGSVDVASGARLDQKSVFGATSGMYANTKNIYTLSNGVADGQTVTNILRFAIEKGQITCAATARVQGTPLNQFSMDEYEGVFRIVTTCQKMKTAANGNYSFSVGDPVNNVYLLNQDLQILGKIEDLAKGERVYSVRFMGKTGYFVTFRETDPLFSVDLSDPTAPKILGELKIPGFSNYLHPWGNDLLLGLGMDADENGVTKGLKLSMFQIADPQNVTEAHTLCLDAHYTEAQYNHKAILADPQNNIIGFSTVDNYEIYGYDTAKGFALQACLPTDSYNTRGLYIDNVFYLYTEAKICVYTLDTFTPLGAVDL